MAVEPDPQCDQIRSVYDQGIAKQQKSELRPSFFQESFICGFQIYVSSASYTHLFSANAVSHYPLKSAL